MMKTVIMLTVTAVLFAITSNVSEAAKINPNPLAKAGTAGKAFNKRRDSACFFKHSQCTTGNYEAEDMTGCAPRRRGAVCRQKRQKARCDREYAKCTKKR